MKRSYSEAMDEDTEEEKTVRKWFEDYNFDQKAMQQFIRDQKALDQEKEKESERVEMNLEKRSDFQELQGDSHTEKSQFFGAQFAMEQEEESDKQQLQQQQQQQFLPDQGQSSSSNSSIYGRSTTCQCDPCPSTGTRCRRRPGRRIHCTACGQGVGPGCCWVTHSCHKCSLTQEQEEEDQRRKEFHMYMRECMSETEYADYCIKHPEP